MGFGSSSELFSILFEHYDISNPSDILTNIISTNWGEYKPNRITGTDASLYYGSNRNKLEPYSDTFKKYFKFKPTIENLVKAKILEMYNGHSNIIGIIVRNSGNSALANEQPKGRH
jgi:hypothetical protein